MSVNIFWVKMCTCIVFISPEVFANFLLLVWRITTTSSLSLSLSFIFCHSSSSSFFFFSSTRGGVERRKREREIFSPTGRRFILFHFFFSSSSSSCTSSRISSLLLFFTSLPDSLVVSLKEVVLNEETTKSTKWRIRRNTILPVPSLFPSLFDRKIGWYTMSVGSQQPTQLFHASVSCRVTRFPCFFLHQISRPKLLSRSL